MRTRPALLLACTLFAMPATALNAADAPRPVRPPSAVHVPDKGPTLLDLSQWLSDRFRALGNPFGFPGKGSGSISPANPTPSVACLDPDRTKCPI